MDQLVIEGGPSLNGVVSISGAKNAVLPILAATLLVDKPVVLRNIPHLDDVTTMIELLGRMGADIVLDKDLGIEINNQSIVDCHASYELVKRMRASILVLGPLLARFGQAKVSFPGGCAIGSRPVNAHLEAMCALGANISMADGFIEASVPGGRLKGTELDLSVITVTGTENIIMAATLAKGRTIIHHAAREPEVQNLANFLNHLGAKISGIGTSTIIIDGVDHLQGGEYRILPDRIEAGTYLVAAAITRGHIIVKDVWPSTLTAVLDALKKAGADLTIGSDYVELNMHHKRPKPVDIITAPYPAMPTDMQAQFMVLNTLADGHSTVVEKVFENRFLHVQELQRMGASIKLQGNKAIIEGKEELIGNNVINATDLRASACLVLAALKAVGCTVVDFIHHIDRGYERIEEKFLKLGAKIHRKTSSSL